MSDLDLTNKLLSLVNTIKQENVEILRRRTSRTRNANCPRVAYYIGRIDLLDEIEKEIKEVLYEQ